MNCSPSLKKLLEVDYPDVFSDIKKTIEEVGPANVDLVIEGETGTGKDTLARKIHAISSLKGKFVAVNCAAIPETLAESEFFGVTSGAYTGAEKSRCGYIEAAHNGTLYLDEIDSMPLTLQAKLLRVLENRGVERLGSTHFVKVDMRIIVSTKVPLEQLVERKLFRRDLYYRLSIVRIQLPTLRSMPHMIIPMFKRFFIEAKAKYNHKSVEFDESVCPLLLMHDWPGNARELKAAAERCVLGMPPLDNVSNDDNFCLNKGSLKDRLEKLEKHLIEKALYRHRGCVDNVVTELRVPKRTLYYRMKKLNIIYDNIVGKNYCQI